MEKIEDLGSKCGGDSNFIPALQVSEVPTGGSATVEIAGREIAVFNAGGRYYAVDDRCPDAGFSLGRGGKLDGEVLTCGHHFWQFNLRTGASLDDLCDPIACYVVRVEGGTIYVSVDEKPRCETIVV